MTWKELTTGIYPWDMHDEGIEHILDVIQEVPGNNAAYMLGIMHNEKRPYKEPYYPHNPVRKRYLAEDSRCYWEPDPENYRESRIKPIKSDRKFLQGTDWLEQFSTALRSRGMKVGVEISHTPLDKERATNEFSDCIQRDIYGRTLRQSKIGQENTHIGQLLCWNNPHSRQYMRSLLVDLASRYDLDMIQTCVYLFCDGYAEVHPVFGLMLGGCFCDSCRSAALKSGYDWDLITATVREYAGIFMRETVESNEQWLLLEKGDSSPSMLMLERPELFEWMKFRTESTNRFIKEISEAVHKANPKIDLRFNNWNRVNETSGLDMTKVSKYVDSVRLMDYAEQTGDERKVDEKGIWISNIRRQAGYDVPIISAVAPRSHATPALIRKGVRLAALAGADGLSYGFYDCARIENLRAIKEGMEEAEVNLET